MNKLSPAAQALIEAARHADDPTPQARARGDAAVRVALAMHGVTDLPALAQASSQGPSPSLDPSPVRNPTPDPTPPLAAGTKAGAGLGLKIGLGLTAAVVLSAGMLAWRAGRVDERPAQGALQAPPPHVASALGMPGTAADEPAAGEIAAAMRVEPTPQPATSGSDRKRAARKRARRAGAAGDAIEVEVRMIAEANAHAREARFEEALEVLARHAQRFPRGALREERKALRALSLCGHAPDARARREGERFLRHAPRSVLAARVRAACTGS